ncbi:MAG: GNAT family N-acetyltransferase [Candidatus Hydrogenedentes bacterium]|nr:GNAT family N-acetyltransferase [Candidatus Hydrogenedentota bacterium]
MNVERNEFGQPIGPIVENWRVPPRPAREVLSGAWCRLEPLDPDRHARDLFEAYACAGGESIWTYLGYGPFDTLAEYRAWIAERYLGEDPLFFAIVDASTDRAAGVASYLRIDPNAGAIEVGHLAYSPRLQRSRAATEAMYLMMRNAFQLGYRRYEWKCHALNEPSRNAALRLGFTFEGIFRQALVVKGRNRDTAWFSIVDGEWPRLEAAFAQWLAPDNFDAADSQRTTLAAIRQSVRMD